MAVRRERVILDVESNAAIVFARDAAAAKLLSGSLDDLSGSAVRSSRGIDASTRSAAGLGDSSRRSGAEIDKLSGRLRLLTDAALILGPALAPLGAASLGGAIALTAQLGAMAGALGVTVLAVNGLGDGLEALNAYQLDPTSENLAKLNEEMEKLGPSGEAFVRYLDAIAPQLKSLQFAARDGLLPGAQEGIDHLLERLPELRDLIARFSTDVGDLTSDAGAAFASDRFDDFFEYLRNDGVPILDDTARTLGFLAEAAANTMQAFAPLQTDVSGGLLDWAEGLAEASADLEGSDGLNGFLTYAAETGPQVLDTLGAIANMVLQVVEATAPLGGPVLQSLEAIANAVALIADSDLGTPIFAALGALALYNRAAAATAAFTATSFGSRAQAQVQGYAESLLTVTSAQDRARLSAAELSAVEGARNRDIIAGAGKAAAAMAGLTLATTGWAESTGVSNAATLALMGTVAGPWGAALGGAAGLTLDFAAANDGLEDSLNAVRLAADSGNISLYADSIANAREELEKMRLGNDEGFLQGALGGLGGLSELPEAWSLISGATGRARDELSAAEAEFEHMRETGDRSVGTLGDFADVMRDSAEAAQEEAEALQTATDAMREKRAEASRGLNAELDYQQAIDDARQALKQNGKTVDETTEKGRDNLRALYALADGWNAQSDAAKNAQGSLRTARRGFVETATSMGLPIEKARQLARALFEIPPKRRTEVTAETAAARANIAAVRAQLDGLDGKTARTYILTIRRFQGAANNAFGALESFGSAEGGTVPKSGRGYADRYHYMLADGEEVISNRHGQADRHRALLKAINANHLAGGGTAGGNGTYNSYTGQAFGYGFNLVADAAEGAARGLRGLKKQLEEQQKAYDRAKSQRDEAISRRDSISSSIQQGLMGDDLWAAPQGNVWAAGAMGANPIAAANARADRARRLVAALNTLKQKGVTGPALLEIIGTGDVERAEAMAALPVEQLGSFSSALNTANAELAAAGLAGGNAIEGDNIRVWREQTDKQLKKLNDIEQAIKQAEESNEKAQDKNAQQVAAGVNGAASSGWTSGNKGGRGGRR